MCSPMWSHWRHLVNMTELVLPSAHRSPQPKWQIDQFSCFCTAYGRNSLYFTMGAPFPKIARSHRGYGPHLTHDSLGPSEPITQKASQSIQPFLHRRPQSVPTLYNGTSPLKIAPSHWGSGLPSNTWFPGPTRAHNPNSISNGSAVFAGLTSETDQQTTLLGR